MKHKEIILCLIWVFVFLLVGFSFMYWSFHTMPERSFRYFAIWIGFIALLWMTSSRARYHSRKYSNKNKG